jgi:hypothetical protein
MGWWGHAAAALHLGLAFHVHSSIEVSGVRHGDLHLRFWREITRNHAAEFLSLELFEQA